MRKSTSCYSCEGVRKWSSHANPQPIEASSAFGILRVDEERMNEHEANESPSMNADSSFQSDGGVRRGLAEYARKTRRHLPIFMFVAAIALASFAYGSLVGRFKLFPYSIVSDGVKTLRTLVDTNEIFIADQGLFRFWAVDVQPESAAANRIRATGGDTLDEPLLWHGGRFQFMELCPEWGCLAVEFGTDGGVAHAYPFRLDELEQAANAAADDEFPYELAPTYSFARDVYPAGMSRYPNGDLLVVFHINNDTSFPYGAGAARIDRGGHPVWFRRDYSHHWPQIEDDGSALVPGQMIGSASISFQIEGTGRAVILECDTGKPYLDTVNIIDGSGYLVDRFNVVDALLDSPFVSVLQYTSVPGDDRSDFCDPIHLNYIHRLGDDVGGAWGMAPGDLVASMRSLSAFAILDGGSGRIKRVVRGSFFHQHSVEHLEGSRFLMFDNRGGDGVHGPSRLLMVDLADGRETTIFPNDDAPESLRGLYSITGGKIDISPDRSRAMVVFARRGMAVEVRLSDGEVLNVFRSVHDVSGLEQFGDERATQSAVFQMFGLDYISERESPISSQE